MLTLLSHRLCCERLWQDEILPTVPQPEGEDLPAIAPRLCHATTTAAIQHRTWQIAMDGSQKLLQRILSTLRDNLAAGRMPKGLCLVIAEAGCAMSLAPMRQGRQSMSATRWRRNSRAASAPDPVTALMSIEAVFGCDLSDNANRSRQSGSHTSGRTDKGVKPTRRWPILKNSANTVLGFHNRLNSIFHEKSLQTAPRQSGRSA